MIEMGAADIGLTIHPHPTLSETIGMDAEPFEGTITDCTDPGRNEAGAYVMNSIPQSADAKGYLENLMRAGQDAVKQFDDALATAAGIRSEESASSGRLFFPFSMSNDVVIVSAARTPVGSFNGAFATTQAHDLGAGKRLRKMPVDASLLKQA